jgi:uncharacterized ferritin-like protein (DUF455 family)
MSAHTFLPDFFAMNHASFPPPLAGLCTHAEAGRTGLPVDETVSRLRRYAFLKRELVLLAAARLNGLPEWEVKTALSLHLWQDAEHCTSVRKRIMEMRTPPHHLDRAPDPRLNELAAELRKASSSAEYLVAIYGVLKPAFAAALRNHLARSHPIADHPTIRVLKVLLAEEEEQIVWGRAALAAMANGSVGAHLETWRAHVERFVAAVGGVAGDSIADGELPAAWPQPVQDTARVPRRDGRFKEIWQSRGVPPDPMRSPHERLWWLMGIRLNEMHVSELIATVIADWHGQPWEFYHDLARHLWDETRHCLLGEVAFVSQGIDFTKIPMHVGFAEYPNTSLSPADRYAFLWGIEQGMMPRTGKQAEVALAREAGDEVATIFQDYDWADEVLHTAIGRRWLEPHYGSREALADVYEKARAGYDAAKNDDLKKNGRDWWPAFYEQHLKHRDPGLAAAKTS